MVIIMISGISGKISKIRNRNIFARWAKPYAIGTGEINMIRFLDDADVPCYQGVWMAADKNRFHQERAPGGLKKYIMNPDLWCYQFKDSLTCVSVANEYPYPGNTVPNFGWQCKRGVTAITKRHIVSCGHAPISFSNNESYPTRIRFCDKNGETVDRILIGQKYCYSNSHYVNVNGVQVGVDSWIGTLDEDLPDSVHIARCIPNHFKLKSPYAIWDECFVTQSMEAESWSTQQPARQKDFYGDFIPPNYPLRHRTMCSTSSRYSNGMLTYRTWAGDSGMPVFYGFANELLFAGFAAGGGAGPRNFPRVISGQNITWADLTNTMIMLSDDDAISRGKLSSRTGYTITEADEIIDLLPP